MRVRRRTLLKVKVVNETILNITQYTGNVLEQAYTNSLENTFIVSFEPLLYLLFGLAVLVAGHYVKNWAIVISSGVWFLGVVGSSLVGSITIGFSSVLFFALFGILVILHGISSFYDQEEPNTVKLNND